MSSFPGAGPGLAGPSKHGRSRRVPAIGTIGKEATIREIYEISQVTSNIVRDSLGPLGLWNIVVDETGHVHRLRTGSAILNRIAPKQDPLKEPKQSEESMGVAAHPVTEILSQMARAVTKNVGDGSKTAVILTAEIVAQKYNSKLSTGMFLTGCFYALDECIGLLREVSIPLSVTRSHVGNVARTFFDGGFMTEESELLTKVIVDAVVKGSDIQPSLIDDDAIGIKREIGGSILDTSLLDGVAFFGQICNPNMPRIVENARVALLSGALSSGFTRSDTKLRTREYDHEIIIHEPEDFRTLFLEKRNACAQIVRGLQKLEVGAILVGKGVEPEIEGMLAKHGILAVANVYIEDLQRAARLTGGRIVSEAALLMPEDLGKAQFIKEEKIGAHSWIFVGGQENMRVLTVLVRGFSDAIIDDAESRIRDSLRVLKGFVSQPRVVFGGGATEVELAMRLRKRASTVDNRKQIAIGQLADALESIPAILAASCGLDPTDSVANLRALHTRGKSSIGIDTYRGEIGDMHKAGICTPLPVYDQVIKSSFETAAFLLRIDDIIAAKVLRGEDYWRKRTQQFTEPKREKAMSKDYGLGR